MKQLWLVGLLFFLTATPLAAQTPSTAEKELLKLEDDWNVAGAKKDAALLDRILAAEYFGTGVDGTTTTKSQELATLKGSSTRTPFVLSALKAQVYGDTAVVTGVNTGDGVFDGKEVKGAIRFTDVFVRRDGRWQCVASQGTYVAKK